MKFQPRLGMSLYIPPHHYAFVPHPLFAGDEYEVFVIEGGEALIYQMQDLATQSMWGLKVTKPSCRDDHIMRAAASFASIQDLLGFSVKERINLTRDTYPELIATFPDLEYAILMPWLAGKTWAGLMLDRAASANYTPAQAHDLALATVQVLWSLETSLVAHTDIAGSNVVLSSNFKSIELLDIEGLYMRGIPMPKRWSRGSPGYQHRHLDGRGQWRSEGDRFAGAILLTEMLTWCDPVVRALTPEDAETLFQSHELQQTGFPLWRAVRNVLWKLSPDILNLFDQAWASPDLTYCPDFGAWIRSLATSLK